MKTRHPVQLSGLLKCIWTTMITMKWRNKLHQLSQTGTQEKHKYFLLTDVSQTHLTPQKEPRCLNHVQKIPLTTCKSSLNQLLTIGDLHLPESRWQEVKQNKMSPRSDLTGHFQLLAFRVVIKHMDDCTHSACCMLSWLSEWRLLSTDNSETG